QPVAGARSGPRPATGRAAEGGRDGAIRSGRWGSLMSPEHEASAPEHEIAIQLLGVNKWFGAFHVLRDINLSIARKERVVVCGPSGSGKSTMIRCINRLEEHQQGRIIVDGIELTNDLKNIEAIRREVGM